MKIDKKTIIAIVLIVAALGVVLYQMRGMFTSGKPAATAVAATTSKPAHSNPANAASKQAAAKPSGGNDLISLMADDYSAYIANLKEENIDFSSKKFRNPMTPIIEGGDSGNTQNWGPLKITKAPEQGPTVEQLSQDDTIEGIVWNDTEPLALVNDQVVGVGEALEDGAVVTSITQDTVRFSRNGNRYYLVLREE